MREQSNNTITILGDEDYCRLQDLYLPLAASASSSSSSSPPPPPPPPPPPSRDDKSFIVCLWIYLVKKSVPGVLLRMVCSETKEERPLLSIDPEQFLNLYSWDTSFSVSAQQACPLEKWVHIGCEVDKGVIRLHVDGIMTVEKHLTGPTSYWQGTLIIMGGSGGKSSDIPQEYVHHARVLPQPTVSNHYVKHPPLELALDGSTGASDDYEVEEGGDGIWSVVGGKASCRRNFALDVVLLDALGRSVHKDMEILALLIYADNNHPVEKPKDDAEAPLLTTFDGVEFPSTERPIKLVHGRASFKLKISQLSSKCDNRLFRVCFDSPNLPCYPFLQVFSRPIRCVSRNRNSRCPSLPLKRSLITDASWMPEESVTEPSFAYANASNVPTGMKWYPGQYQSKRARVVPEPLRYMPYRSSETYGIQLNCPTPDINAFPPVGGRDEEYARIPRNSNAYENPLSCSIQKEITLVFDHPTIEEKCQESMDTTNFTWSHGPTFTGPLLDFLVFKYSLEGIQSRAAFLRGVITCWSDQLLSEFAKQVSHVTSCKHTGHQILIARNLIQDGNQVWKEIVRNAYPVSWEMVMEHVERHLLDSLSFRKRRFSHKDKLFFKRLTKCGARDILREDFDKLWNWIYPVCQSLLDPRVRSTWEIEEPKHILSMVSREEVEALMRCSDAPLFMLRFVSTCSWPHPDAGGLILTYVGKDLMIHHKLLSLDNISRFNTGNKRSLLEMILAQEEFSQARKPEG